MTKRDCNGNAGRIQLNPLLENGRRAVAGALFVAIVAALSSVPAPAQLFASRHAAIASGHVHINTADFDEQKRFWHMLGGQTAHLHGTELIQFPDLLILFNHQKPTGGTRGSSVNHIGFEVRDVRETVRRAKAAGYEIVTQQEVSGGQAKGEIFHSVGQDVYLAFLMGPEGLKVELMGNPKLEQPIIAHHFHLAAPDVYAVRDWYVSTFGFTPETRGKFEESRLPGIRVSMLQEESVTGTSGRVIDHIGFEGNGVRHLCEVLSKRGAKLTKPYTLSPKLKTASAFLQDPVGTTIELTEGLKQVGGIGPGAPLP